MNRDYVILCTFEDGTTELRPADSSATAAGGSFRLWMVRGEPDAQVPRGDGWAPCRVETSDDQIDRLTRERDEARDVARRLAALDFNEPPSLYDAAQVQAWGGPRR